MNTFLGYAVATALATLLVSGVAAAQPYEALGTRAAGMGGAFVSVADDASAVYWNPAGLAAGAFFGLILDRVSDRAAPEGAPRAASGSGVIASLVFPALGVSYYRLRSSTVSPPLLDPSGAVDLSRDPMAVRLQSLITHHSGVTLVQSLVDRVAVGAALKLVRGIAAVGPAPDGRRDDLLDDAAGLVGVASNRFDADLGVMAAFQHVRAGLTIRNVTAPEFSAAGGAGDLRLERQARAGVALTPREGVILAADLDLLRTAGPMGEIRNFALGGEARLAPRAFVRAGARVNTLENRPAGRTPVFSVGGSYVARNWLLADGQLTLGSERAGRGWGIGMRVVF